jgi:hypothetical protein
MFRKVRGMFRVARDAHFMAEGGVRQRFSGGGAALISVFIHFKEEGK